MSGVSGVSGISGEQCERPQCCTIPRCPYEQIPSSSVCLKHHNISHRLRFCGVYNCDNLRVVSGYFAFPYCQKHFNKINSINCNNQQSNQQQEITFGKQFMLSLSSQTQQKQEEKQQAELETDEQQQKKEEEKQQAKQIEQVKEVKEAMCNQNRVGCQQHHDEKSRPYHCGIRSCLAPRIRLFCSAHQTEYCKQDKKKEQQKEELRKEKEKDEQVVQGCIDMITKQNEQIRKLETLNETLHERLLKVEAEQHKLMEAKQEKDREKEQQKHLKDREKEKEIEKEKEEKEEEVEVEKWK